uniref:L1 transposable element RRM domain-containing protein n=1 Tax=Latimeria chalumnae TaxID=7897 RepID=H3A3J7_LATCH
IATFSIFLQKMTTDINDLKSTMLSLKSLMEKMETRVIEAEGQINELEEELTAHDTKTQQLEIKISANVAKLDNLENRSCRNNVHIIGFPEGVKNWNPITFLSSVLPAILGLPANLPLDIEKAHHSLGLHLNLGQRPRAFIAKFLRFPTKEKLLRAARDRQTVEWQGHRISVFLELLRDLQLKRQRFVRIHQQLRERGLKFGIFYSAMLKITY